MLSNYQRVRTSKISLMSSKFPNLISCTVIYAYSKKAKQILYEDTQAVYMSSNAPRCSLLTVNVKYLQFSFSRILLTGPVKLATQKYTAIYWYSLSLEAKKIAAAKYQIKTFQSAL